MRSGWPRARAAALLVAVGAAVLAVGGAGHGWVSAAYLAPIVLVPAAGLYLLAGRDSDAGAVTRREVDERLAWQRLVRVLGHEINNSLTPIRSIADRLQQLLGRSPPAGELREDLDRGLGVIAARSEGLSRFLAAYTRLARLPPPRPGLVDVAGRQVRPGCGI